MASRKPRRPTKKPVKKLRRPAAKPSRAVKPKPRRGAPTRPTSTPIVADPSAIAALSRPVREALAVLTDLVQQHGELVQLNGPAPLDVILAAERARGISLPNDFRALLVAHDGGRLHDFQWVGTADLNGESGLWAQGCEFLRDCAREGDTRVVGCVALANLGEPNDWLLFDGAGQLRDGEPGWVMMLFAGELAVDGLAAALARHTRILRSLYEDE